jgi:hypothetical protein
MIDGAVEDLEAFLGKTVAVADREAVESGAVLDPCRAGRRVALIVVGDPLSATTHSDLVVRCHELGVPCRVVHNASVLTAVAQSGLQLYRFGETISLCFWTDTFRPDSWYPKAARNKAAGLHTLCLLDIKVKELTDEQLARPKARSLFDAAPSGPPKPRFMTIAEAIGPSRCWRWRRSTGRASVALTASRRGWPAWAATRSASPPATSATSGRWISGGRSTASSWRATSRNPRGSTSTSTDGPRPLQPPDRFLTHYRRHAFPTPLPPGELCVGGPNPSIFFHPPHPPSSRPGPSATPNP